MVLMEIKNEDTERLRYLEDKLLDALTLLYTLRKEFERRGTPKT